jgi:hypothetical protein
MGSALLKCAGEFSVSKSTLSTPFIEAPPSGIPVASTASIAISGNVFANGTHTRVSQGEQILVTINGDGTFYFVLDGGTYLYRRPNSIIGTTTYDNSVLLAPNSTIKSSNLTNTVIGPYSAWTIVTCGYDNEYDSWSGNIVAENPSTDPTNIPTAGWSPSITITAA